MHQQQQSSSCPSSSSSLPPQHKPKPSSLLHQCPRSFLAISTLLLLVLTTLAPVADARPSSVGGGPPYSRNPPRGGNSAFVPPPPGPPQQQQDPQQQQQQQQNPNQVITRPWGPASSSYTYQRYYSTQPAGSERGGNEVLYPRIMRTVGNTGVCILFMILTARATHLYELADQIKGAFWRYLVTVPVVGLLCANLVGVLLSLVQSFSRNSRLKTRLKAILTLNGLAEVGMVAYNSMRLILGNDKWTPREAYVGRIFTSIWTLTILYAFSTSRWDNQAFSG